ncbi:rhomboid family intramembrane serine protease [Actinomyces sp. W5033]|uniref:rhomboid family intramembrane serine protease n=1 Tax=Actinomyces sp. W5033 TaxID=3446479 RepID=UPI003EDF6EF9
MSQYPAGSVPAVPVCPRHPGRVSYVRCQRCDRPVCPECQVPGAVGVHCVDCVRSAGAARPGVRTVLGGAAVADALLTRLLIGACVVVFVAQQVLASLTSDLLFAPAVALSEPWRFLTTAFLHSSLLHLAFNMWALWVTGTALEPLLGRWRFGALYALSALGGSVMVYLLASPSGASWWTGTVGASGAVFGLFAAMFVIQRRFGRDTSAIVGLLAVNLVISFTGASISWQGHLGGLLTGAAVSALFAWAPRERRKAVGVWGPVAVGLVLLALVAAKALVS